MMCIKVWDCCSENRRWEGKWLTGHSQCRRGWGDAEAASVRGRVGVCSRPGPPGPVSSGAPGLWPTLGGQVALFYFEVVKLTFYSVSLRKWS